MMAHNAVGKQADLVVMKGNPASYIEDIEQVGDIEQVEIVFRDGLGSVKLLDSVKGRYGQH